MRRRRIRYTTIAQTELINIGRWLSRVASERVARRFTSRIRAAIQKLEFASERGSLRDEKHGLRVIGLLPTVTITFTVEEDTVTIHRILHNGQDWSAD